MEMKKTLLITFIIALALISCKKEKIEGKIKTDKKFAAELRSSPETITQRILAKSQLIQKTE